MNILLFSDIPPCTNYTAGIVLNIMCDFLLEAGHRVSCFTVMDKSLDAKIPEDKLSRMSFANVDKPRENWGLGTFKGLASFVGNTAAARFRLPRIAREVGRFAKEQGAELIWCVVQGQTMIKLAEPVARNAGIPYVFQVWDPPEWWMLENKFDKFTTRSVMKAFGSALHHSRCCLAASWAMAEDYSSRYDCRAIPVILGFSPDRIVPKGQKQDEQFVIAFSGQIYATDEFNALLRALDLMNWNYHGKKIVVRLYGRYFHLFFSARSNLEVHGWMAQEDLLPELADADLLYCPYWFSEQYRLPTALSFPSKLSTYLKTARPVLIHAPEYASPRRYLVEHGAGYVCDTLDPEGIRQLLTYIMDLPEHTRNELGEHGYQTFLNTLTTEHMRQSFFRSLDLEEASIPKAVPPPPEKKEDSMRVLFVNNIDLIGNRFNGHDMQLALNARGITAHQAVMERMGSDEHTLLLPQSERDLSLRRRIMELEDNMSLHGMIYPYLLRLMDLPEFKRADVVHYHLLHNYFGAIPLLPEITKRKPSVLTIHDPWLMTGHCIHPFGCTKWQTGCGDCPRLDVNFSMKEDQTALQWLVKKNALAESDLDLVVASQFMMDMVRSSPITASVERVHLIPFGIDTDLFTQERDRNAIRRSFGIPEEDFVLFFRADPSEFKGFTCISKMLELLDPPGPITLLSVGNPGMLREFQRKYQVIELEWITDNRHLADAYCACDLFLMPSAAEAFGMMAIETMASARPVLVCEGTALSSVTYAPECGIVIPQNDSAAMAEVVCRLMAHPEEGKRRGELGRDLALKHYRFEDYVERHLKLYQEMMQRR